MFYMLLAAPFLFYAAWGILKFVLLYGRYREEEPLRVPSAHTLESDFRILRAVITEFYGEDYNYFKGMLELSLTGDPAGARHTFAFQTRQESLRSAYLEMAGKIPRGTPFEYHSDRPSLKPTWIPLPRGQADNYQEFIPPSDLDFFRNEPWTNLATPTIRLKHLASDSRKNDLAALIRNPLYGIANWGLAALSVVIVWWIFWWRIQLGTNSLSLWLLALETGGAFFLVNRWMKKAEKPLGWPNQIEPFHGLPETKEAMAT